MRTVDYVVIEKLHAKARRERAEYVHCLIQRMVLWIRTRLPGADERLREAACC
jgi:hypothetical protein